MAINDCVLEDDNDNYLNDEVDNFKCSVCGEGTSGDHQCQLCKNEASIRHEREKSHQGMKRAAEKMVDETARKLPRLNIGDSVFLNIPKIDRGPLDTKNITGKIVDMKNGVFQVGTANGIIKNWFPRHELQYSSNEYGEQVPNNLLSLREAVSRQSLFGGQGFNKCSCRPAKNQCRTNKCSCFKQNVLCGSKCHSSLSCVNK